MDTLVEKQLIRRYVSGENVRDLAKNFTVAPQTIYNILKKHSVPKRSTRARERATKLLEACHGGAVVALVAKQIGVSESTATRVVRRHRAEGNALVIKAGRPCLSRPRIFSIEGMSPLLAEYAEISGIPFPYPKISVEKFDRELSRLQSFVSHLEDNEIRPKSLVGVPICAPYFPNRYQARSSRNISAYAAWQDASELQKAIRFQIEHGDPITPPRILRAITLRCRTPTIFRPAVAKFICERYCHRGGRVWDPCSGYGGRLLGAFAAGLRYIGTDVDAATIEGNRELARAVSANAKLHLSAAETFDPPSVDLVFTSPPYFDRERYSQEEAQSWRRHGANLDTWISDFLRRIVERAWCALPPTGHLVLNIAELREKRGRIVPLVQRTIETALSAGFLHTETLRMPLGAINRKAPTEPVLVFQKR